MGVSIKTGKRFSGYPTRLGTSTPVVVPVNTVLPAITDPTGHDVGDTLFVSNGSWANGPILMYEYRWLRAGVPNGTTTNSYVLVQPADPGVITGCEVRAQNAAGWSVWVTATGAVTCTPYWTSDPVISGENWPGGTLNRASGVVIGETSQSDDWLVNAVSQGGGATYAVQAADYNLNVVYEEDATNAGGSTNTTSNTILIQQVEGVTRAATVDDYLVINTTETIPSEGTIIVQAIGYAIDTTRGALVCWGGGTAGTGGSVRMLELGVDTASGTRLYMTMRNGTNAENTFLAAANALDGVTSYYAVLRYNNTGSVRNVSYAPVGGVRTEASGGGTYRNPTGGTGARLPTAFRRSVSLTSGGFSGGLSATVEIAATIEIAAFDAYLSDVELDDLVNYDTLAEWGAFSHADLQWYLRPATDQVEGDALTDGATQLATQWNITAGTANITMGLLNVAIP